MATGRAGLRAICCVAWALVAVACGCRSRPERKYYALEAPRPAAAGPAQTGPVLQVRTFSISAPYERSEFVYRTGDSTYESDFYSAFSASPADQIAGQARQWLIGSGLFSRVLGSSGAGEADYVLDGNVASLYGDYRDMSQPKAILEVQFFLLEDGGAAAGISAQEDYRMEVPLAEHGPAGLARGWNEALRQVLADLEQRLRAAIARQRPAEAAPPSSAQPG